MAEIFHVLYIIHNRNNFFYTDTDFVSSLVLIKNFSSRVCVCMSVCVLTEYERFDTGLAEERIITRWKILFVDSF